MEISIVIPVYRSEKILPSLVEQIHESMKRLGSEGSFELILVNDCSPDSSWNVIQSLSQQYSFIRGISLRRNFGQHNATMAGLNQVQGRYIIIMDDDLQHPPAAIEMLLNELKKGYDVCYTNYKNRQHVAWKKWGSQINNWVAGILLNKPKNIYLSSFKAIRKEVVDEVIQYDGPYAYVDGLILDTTCSITQIEIEHQVRFEGEGNYNLKSSFSLWLKMATSFSILPLRIASYAGILLAFVSFITILYVVAQRLIHPELPAGWTSLIAAILLIGGIQMFCMGIIGEYLGRSYLKLNHKKQFVISSDTKGNREKT